MKQASKKFRRTIYSLTLSDRKIFAQIPPLLEVMVSADASPHSFTASSEGMSEEEMDGALKKFRACRDGDGAMGKNPLRFFPCDTMLVLSTMVTQAQHRD